MPTRIVYGLVVVAALVTLFVIDRSADGWLLCGLVLGVAALGLREVFRLLPPVDQAIRITVHVAAAATVLAAMGFPWALGVVFAAPVAIAVASLAGADPRASVASLTSGMFAWIYLGLFPAALLWLRHGPEGWAIVATVLAATKAADIGAYFTGRAIGKTPLVPRLSPKKTVEGLCGGLALAGFAGWLLAKPLLGITSLGWFEAGLFGAGVGAIGTLGDLLESQLKRSAGAKDSGALLPEFGGVLDMIDSPLLTAPAALAYVLLR